MAANEFAYLNDDFHASVEKESDLKDVKAVARRYNWIKDEYKSELSDGNTKQEFVDEPYQWLEDPDSNETKEWVNSQVSICNKYLDNVKGSKNDIPLRKEIMESLKENLKYGRYSTPYRKKNYYFYRFNEGTWNQSKLYVLPKESNSHEDIDTYLKLLSENKSIKLWTDDKHVLIDPNTLSKDGTSQLKGIYHSENGEFMAYGISEKGSDWVAIHVKNVKEFVDNIDSDSNNESKDNENENEDSNEDENAIDVLKHCKFTSVTWTHDNKGFFYTRYEAPKKQNTDTDKAKDKDKETENNDSNDKDKDKEKDKESLGTETTKLANQQLYYHKMGTSQQDDAFIIDAQTLGNEDWMIGHGITYDGTYLLLEISSDCDPVNRLFICQNKDKNMITQNDGTKSILENMIKLVDNFDAGYDYITNNDTLFYFKTNYNAPNYRVIKINIKSDNIKIAEDKDKGNYDSNKLPWEEVIKEKDCRLEEARCVGKTEQHLYLDYTKDVKTELYLTSMDGKDDLYLINAVKEYNSQQSEQKEKEKEERQYFPAHGCLGAWGNQKFDEGFIHFESWLHPGSIYHFNFHTKKLLLFAQIIPKGFNADEYVTEQVYFRYFKKPLFKSKSPHYNDFEILNCSNNKSDLINIDESKDNEHISPIIPMYILYKKSLISINPKTGKKEVSNPLPTILYGYGGFDISLMPYFSSTRLTWLKNFNGCYAISNIRGGGEYGEKWHNQGTKLQKQNVFNDFQASGICLINKLNYTNINNLSIEGGSNGGLLVAACCNQRPDLFKCGIAHVGVLDMLKFHKFTIGYAWTSDYGSSDNSNQFKYIYNYSPLHNIPNPSLINNKNNKEGEYENSLEIGNNNQYPCFLGLTADHDDRVSPLHSFKFIAELQYKFRNYGKQINPLLIRIDVAAGHGGSNLTKAIENRADVYTFVSKSLNANWIPDQQIDDNNISKNNDNDVAVKTD